MGQRGNRNTIKRMSIFHEQFRSYMAPEAGAPNLVPPKQRRNNFPSFLLLPLQCRVLKTVGNLLEFQPGLSSDARGGKETM
jgi:hypothetical protein